MCVSYALSCYQSLPNAAKRYESYEFTYFYYSLIKYSFSSFKTVIITYLKKTLFLLFHLVIWTKQRQHLMVAQHNWQKGFPITDWAMSASLGLESVTTLCIARSVHNPTSERGVGGRHAMHFTAGRVSRSLVWPEVLVGGRHKDLAEIGTTKWKRSCDRTRNRHRILFFAGLRIDFYYSSAAIRSRPQVTRLINSQTVGFVVFEADQYLLVCCNC